MGVRDVGTIVGESLCRDVRGKFMVIVELQATAKRRGHGALVKKRV